MEIVFPIFSSMLVCSVLLCFCIRYQRQRRRIINQQTLESVYVVIPYQQQQQQQQPIPSAPPAYDKDEDPRS